jgi:serine/threonine protein kinase
MTDLIGQSVGAYRITALLGRGGMATVFRARQMTMDRDVAIKVIKPELAVSKDFTARFEREAKMVASLSHSHILKVFDYGHHADMGYLVMEYLAGGSLADLIEHGPLPIERTLRFFEQIAQALDYAHRQGIIHRDLKPQNVLLDDDQNAMLTDFGLAKLAGTGTQLTHTGLTVGTPAYMAPEQWQGSNIDKRADIYSLGVMLYEALSGTLPFNGDTPFRVMHMHIYEFPPLLIERDPNLPPGVDMVLMKALGKKPEERYASAGAMVAAFREALSGTAGSRSAEESPSTPQPGSSFPSIKLISIAQLQSKIEQAAAADQPATSTQPRSRPTASVVQRPSVMSGPTLRVDAPATEGKINAAPAAESTIGVPKPFRGSPDAANNQFRDPTPPAARTKIANKTHPNTGTKKTSSDPLTAILAALVVLAVGFFGILIATRTNAIQTGQSGEPTSLTAVAAVNGGATPLGQSSALTAPTVVRTATNTNTPLPTRTQVPSWTPRPTNTTVVSRPRATVRTAVATKVAVASKPVARAKTASTMYLSPGTDHPTPHVLDLTVRYDVLLRTEINSQAWYQLRFDGTKLAWVPGSAITITPTNADIPYVPPPPQ